MTDAASGFRCPLCGGERARVHLLLRDALSQSIPVQFPLVRCAGCGLLRLHPPPDAAVLACAYPLSYAPFQRAGLSGWAKSWLERRSVRQLWRYCGPPKSVLDVGCSTGELLLAIRAAGNARVQGVEPSTDAARLARQRGLAVSVGTLEDADLPASSVDTVLMSHTLEHVRDPLATLHEVARVLRPGGALILWLPNVESIEARALRQRWIGYDAPRHLTTFGVTTLTHALRCAGFAVAEVRHEAVGLEWAWALRLWVRERWPRADGVLSKLHPLSVVLATPLAALGALRRRSGRVRMVAVKTS